MGESVPGLFGDQLAVYKNSAGLSAKSGKEPGSLLLDGNFVMADFGMPCPGELKAEVSHGVPGILQLDVLAIGGECSPACEGASGKDRIGVINAKC